MKLENWKLSCFYPFVPYFGNSIEAGVAQKSILPPVPAKVPGSVQGALLAAGLLEDPYYEMNSLRAEWVENKWWMYETSFDLPDDGAERELVFEGIDYKARIFLNGQLCGESENMFVPLVIPLQGIARAGKNDLRVVLEGAPEENAQIGYSSRTHTQKSRFNYKWDFCTRLVHLGLNGPVTVRRRPPVDIASCRFRGHADGNAEIELGFRAARPVQAALRITVSDGDKILFSAEKEGVFGDGDTFRAVQRIEGVKPWYPNGYGEQPLYTLRAAVTAEGETEIREARVGFRDIVLEKNEGRQDAPYPYQFRVNGQKIYVKGVNVVPLDMLYGDIPPGKHRALVRLLRSGNVNFIRVWGGGCIGSEELYSAADECGILVWQEFIQSGSGIESLPSVEPAYLENLRKTAEYAVTRAIHPSLAAFSGGNELTDNGKPIGFENANLAMLREVVQKYCPDVYMFPTSASGANEFLDLNNLGAMHDVHGPWKFECDPAFYQLYNRSDSLFHSEFGCDGMANREIIDRYFSAENRKVSDVGENYVWRHHGEWWDTSARDRRIFGEPASLDEQIALSQFLQAEGIRYAVEANRRRAFGNSGSIIWQANEPYPNIYGTNLIDYFGNPKFAWYSAAQAFAPVNPNLEYDSFVREPGEAFCFRLYLTADGPAADYRTECRVTADGKEIFQGGKNVLAGDGRTTFVLEGKADIPDCSAVLVQMTAACGGKTYSSEVLFPVRRGSFAPSEPVLEYMKNRRTQ